jgi:hypothetical protein
MRVPSSLGICQGVGVAVGVRVGVAVGVCGWVGVAMACR